MSDVSKGISFVGQIDILRANIITVENKSIDITNMIGELSIYEDLFSNTMSGHILIQDALDLINTLPLIGQELFEIELNTPTLDTRIKKTFYIYKLQHRKSNKRSQTYMLNFCSKELIYSENSKVSRAFSGNIGETVADIFTDDRYLASAETLYVDKTKNSYSFIAPYWTPFETINWLTGKSINKRGVANYLFFETNQSFEYTSVDTLIRSEPIREYIYSDVGADTAYDTQGEKDIKYGIVESIDTAVTFDYLRNLNAGMYSAKLYTLDLTTKNINTHNYDYISDFGKSSHLDKHPLKTNELLRKKIASLYFIEKNNYQSGEFQKQGYSEFFLQRNSLLEQLNAFKISIKVPGRTDIKVGNTIKLTMMEMRQILGDEIDTTGKSDYYCGKYLITAIRHQVINGHHTMFMEIISDSFIKQLLK